MKPLGFAMRKFFSFRTKRRQKQNSLPFTTPLRNGMDVRIEKSTEFTKCQKGYKVREKDLKKIHRAAVVGNVARVQQILLLGKKQLE